jgi:hypothetical protein
MESFDELGKQTVIYSILPLDFKERKDALFFNTVLPIHQPLLDVGILDLSSTSTLVREKVKLAERKNLLSKASRDSFSMVVNMKHASKLIQCLVQNLDETTSSLLKRIFLEVGLKGSVTLFTVKKLSGEEFNLTVMTISPQEDHRLFGERHTYSVIKVPPSNCVICL